MDFKRNLQNSTKDDNQDMPVIDFLNSLDSSKEYDFLEIGSGMCRFTKKIKSLYPNIHITCVEINPKLAAIAKEEGFTIYNSNILETTINKQFDIVHCSHVIEHFPYPQVTSLLDKIVEWTKPMGHFIIISPLMWELFYADIDHVRPYLPISITHYFNYEMQQKMSDAKINVEMIWYRTMPKQLNPITSQYLIYAIKPLRRFINRVIIPKINQLYEFLWKRYRCPASAPNGYVMINQLVSKGSLES